MLNSKLWVICITLLSLIGLTGCANLRLARSPVIDASATGSSVYAYRTNHHPDGIGKVYMGREIAQVMGHQGAVWLERPNREWEEQPNALIEALELGSNAVVADIGAGTGYLTFRISPRVPEGKVYAVDVQPEMVDMLNFFKQDLDAANVEPVLGSATRPNLPIGQVDLALMVDAYHEFEFPQEMMQGIVEALKPGGQVALVEYRGENPLVPIKRLHKMTQRQVRREMQTVGLVWQETRSLLPQQHLMVFTKPGSSRDVMPG